MKTNNVRILVSLIFALFILAAQMPADASPASQTAKPAKITPPVNIIIMIGDGMGFNHEQTASCYLTNRRDGLAWHSFSVKLAMSTYNLDGSYKPAECWVDDKYPTQSPTDSAAAATALSTGMKTENGLIGRSPNGKSLVHIISIAENKGKSTGVVTSVQWSHATPAGFSAHNSSRSNYADIAREMLDTRLDVIMGCGHPYYDNQGRYSDTVVYDQYVGGMGIWTGLQKGTLGGDADNDGIDDKWTLVTSRDSILKMRTGQTPKRVVATMPAQRTLQLDRANVYASAPFSVAFNNNMPTLAQMTEAALNVLDNDEDGFFLMVEGGAVDWASHANQTGRMIEELSAFNDAVNSVIAWIEKNGGWDNTLLIVTADHETGYLVASGNTTASVTIAPKGKNTIPDVSWRSRGHTNHLVPLYAEGAGASLFNNRIKGNDPVRGKYVDNIAVSRLVKRLLRKQ